ncbi:Chorismate mutase of the AroH class [Gloeomargarita lithophora Alchichica-D10]|uniref:chorismate mutase n=1 Tax=Gloeomargarita lithophora Alchichica-D10 TaxID=1188229 RepID=A0A1J0A9G8_9CYAN|nr:chorismate mutase [Gloeomargarita lithophora]APB32571.1 Chorismate mutase of the AroH class [Gloeomargarita lithophora Alchichica-D10]
MESAWTWRALRGATTAEANTVAAIREVVLELLTTLEQENHLDPRQLLSVTFSITSDLDAIYPATIARERPRWDEVAMLDVQHMYVAHGLPRCIRLLAHAHLPPAQRLIHPYLRGAKQLRPDWSFRR